LKRLLKVTASAGFAATPASRSMAAVQTLQFQVQTLNRLRITRTP
jgi:hypothetical protein